MIRLKKETCGQNSKLMYEETSNIESTIPSQNRDVSRNKSNDVIENIRLEVKLKTQAIFREGDLTVTNNATIGQLIFISFCLMASICFSYGATTGNKPQKRGGLPYDQLWGETEVKKFLKLPYNEKFNIRVLPGYLKKNHELYGINGFAVVSKLNETSSNDVSLGGVLFRVCNTDLSIFEVDIYSPVSCESACDSLFKWVTFTLPLWNNIPEIFIPQYNNKVYSLLRRDRCEKFYFDISKGIMIHVSHHPLSIQIETEPSNSDSIIAQIDQIIDGMLSFLNGKYKVTDEQKTEYNKIRQKYKQAIANEKQKK